MIMPKNSKIEAPYGSWSSPITADLIVADSVRIGEAEGVGNSIIFSEMRASEKGRLTLVEFENEQLTKHTQHLSLIHISEPTRPY